MSSSLLSEEALALAGQGELQTLPTTKPAEDKSRSELERIEKRRRETIRKRDAAYRRLLVAADLLAVGAVLVAGAIAFGDDSLTPIGTAGALLLVVLVMKMLGLYDRDEHLLRKTTLDELPALFEVATLLALLLWLGGDQIVDGDIGRRQVLGMWVLMIALFVVGRSVARTLARAITPAERCLLLGDQEAADHFRSKVAIGGAVKVEMVGWLPTDTESAGNGNGNGSPPALSIPGALDSVITGADVHRIVLAPGRVDSDVLIHAVRKLRTHGVSVSVLPATPQVTGTTVEVDDVYGLHLLGVRSFEMGRSSRVLKRSFDLVLTSVMLLLLSPLLLLIALAIKLDSRGPVLFRQRRIGRHGQPFEIFKFRSMNEGAHAEREGLRELNDAEGLFKLEEDPRVTRVGGWLRRSSLDELPQLVNVIRGEMSLVGPRPLIPEEDSLVEGLYRRRLDLAPGITGYWQALGSSRIPLHEMVRLDYLYVANWSVWNDLRILLRTIPYVARRSGR
jgi:exopolysaccharide biosynthesis polyprenyl glycosylphosphotransferase